MITIEYIITTSSHCVKEAEETTQCWHMVKRVFRHEQTRQAIESIIRSKTDLATLSRSMNRRYPEEKYGYICMYFKYSSVCLIVGVL